jgi:ribosome-associated toxin RatA of RatAB toxin-antitoxin module
MFRRFAPSAFRTALAVLPLLLLAPTSAHTAPLAGREVQRFDVRSPGSDIGAGGARVRVSAPTNTLRAVVTDYARYSSILGRFKKSNIVGRSARHTDVYLEVPIMRGVTKIWAVVRFEAPQMRGDEELIVGRMISGNVDRLDVRWRIRKIDATTSQLDCELLIDPDVPAPDSLVLREVRGAAARAVTKARTEAELRHSRG